MELRSYKINGGFCGGVRALCGVKIIYNKCWVLWRCESFGESTVWS